MFMLKKREHYESPQSELIQLQVENFCCDSTLYDSSTLTNYEVDSFIFDDFFI